MMSSCKFVVITAVLTVVAGAGSHLLAQERTKPPAAVAGRAYTWRATAGASPTAGCRGN